MYICLKAQLYWACVVQYVAILFRALQQSFSVANAGVSQIRLGFRSAGGRVRHSISLSDLMDAAQQHKMSSDTTAQFMYSANLSEVAASGGSDTLQTVYTSVTVRAVKA